MNRIFILALLLLSGCAIQPAYDNNPYQARAAALINQYNAAHGTHVQVPVVLVQGTQPLAEAEDHCFKNGGRYYTCYIVISSQLVAQRPDYAMANTVPHEDAHVICVMTVPGCTAGDHGPAWRRIALELGLDPNDGYITNPQPGVE